MATQLLELLASSVSTGWTISIGTLEGSDRAGAPLVSWPGHEGDPRRAHWLEGSWSGPIPRDGRSVPVILLTSAESTESPILIGLVRDRLPADGRPAHVEIETRGSGARLVLDGNALALEARDEAVIQCGESSIRLSRDGTVVVKGRRLLSRSSEANVIRGATVRIN